MEDISSFSLCLFGYGYNSGEDNGLILDKT